MNSSRLIAIYGCLLAAVFGLIVVHAPISVGFGALWPNYADLIKVWKEILLALALVLAIWIATRQGLWRQLFDDWLIRLAGVYAALHVLLLTWQPQGFWATTAGVMIDLRYVLFFVLVYLLVLVAPNWRRLLLKIGAVGAVVVIGFGVLQLFLPPDILKYIGYDKHTTIAPYLTVDQNEDYVRINSTLRGPNPLSAYAVIVLSLLVALAVRQRDKFKALRSKLLIMAAALATSVVLWVGYSRSALVAGLVSVGAIGSIAYGRNLSRRLVLCLVALAVLFGGSLYAIRETDFYAHVIMHENPAEGNDVNSNEGHFESLADGWNRLTVQPLGAGVGSTGSASLRGDQPVIIENQYLFVAHESGWLGLGLFLTLFGLIMWRLWQRRADWLALGIFASGVGLAAIGLLLPVWVDDTVSIIWWGLAAVACATPLLSRSKKRASKDKAKR